MNTNAHRPEANERPSPSPSHEQVSVTAYHLYLEGGCQDGRDWEDWFRAEQLLKESLARASAKSINDGFRSEAVTFTDVRKEMAANRRYRTTSRDEVRRRQAPPAARQSQRQLERSGQAR